MDEAAFAVLAAQAGLRLDPAELQELRAAYALVEAMLERLRAASPDETGAAPPGDRA